MAETQAQNYANHRRFDPWYHIFLFGVVCISFLVAVWDLYKGRDVRSLWGVVVAAAWIVLLFKVRLYALAAQDRVIRLEERLRLGALLSEPLRSRIGEITERQLIGLRFAPDAEVPALVEKLLAENLSGDQIKRQIVNWKADTFRV